MFSLIKNRFFSLYDQSIFIIVSPFSQSLSLSPPSRSTPSLSLITKEQTFKSQRFENFIPSAIYYIISPPPSSHSHSSGVLPKPTPIHYFS